MGPRSILRRAPLRLALYSLVALALVWPALGDAARFNEFRDSQILMLHERVAVETVKRFGELPLWDPYYCGGLGALGAPQSRFASPTFLASLALGAERAEILIVFLMVVLGMEGTYRWLRLRVSDAAAAAVVAPVFALSGHFAVAYFRGWTGFFGFELVPWILLGVTLAARGRVAGMAVASIAFATVLGFGGTFAAPLIAVAALLEGLRALSERPRSERRRALFLLTATASFMGAVACVRLWPVAETLAAAPRIMAGTPGNTPKALLGAIIGTLAVKDGDVGMTGSFFVGVAFVLLFVLGAAERKSLRPMIACLVFVWLAQGYARRPAPFGLLRELPVFAALRYPERFVWLAILFGCEPAAHALARLPFIGEGRGWRTGAWLVLGGAVAFTAFQQIATFHRVAGERQLGAIATATATATASPGTGTGTGTSGAGFHQARGNRWLAAHNQALGVGSLSCWETYPVLESPLLRADLPQEEYLADPTSGRATRVGWSPNRIAVDVTLAKDGGQLIVNQNWHPGWRASIGEVVSRDGLLAVNLPGGHHVVRLAFRPWSALAGAAVTIAALLALVVLGVRARFGRQPFARGSRAATLVLVLVPWAVAIAADRLSPEPPWPAPALRNANGTPALAGAAPPASAARIDAAFELPLRVEAGEVSREDARRNVTVDVWLRRTGSIPRATTMFVHLVRRAPPDAAPLAKDTYD
jgi:hypothetical protein